MNKFIIALMLGFVSSISAQTLHIRTDQKGRCGYTDQQGNIIIPCKYDIVFPFSNGIGKVGKGNKYGLVNITGKEIIPVKYDDITLWGNNIYRIRNGNNYGLVSNTGTILANTKYSFISRPNCYGKALITIGGKEKNGILSGAKVGLINQNGKFIIEPKEYTLICEFSPANGRPELNAGKNISVSDTLKTDCSFLSCFSGKKNVVIDKNGKTVTPVTDNATYTIPSSGMCGFAIQNGNKVTSGYWNIEDQKNILVSDKEKKLQAFICTPFTGNVARVDNPITRTSYFIDKSGKRISDDFSRTKHKENYWITYSKDNTCCVLSDKGNFVFERNKYQDFKFPDNNNIFPTKYEGKWGLIDSIGNIIVNFKYDNIETPSYGKIWATKDGKHGIIDTKENIIIPFEYKDIIQTNNENVTNVWVLKSEDNTYYNFNLKSKSIIGEGMKLATNFKDGYAWVIPKAQNINENTIYSGLKEIYNIKAISKINNSFGIVVDIYGNRKSSIPVPQEMLHIISEEIKKNDGNITPEQEKKLLLNHTRAVRIYALSSIISNEEWDY